MDQIKPGDLVRLNKTWGEWKVLSVQEPSNPIAVILDPRNGDRYPVMLRDLTRVESGSG